MHARVFRFWLDKRSQRNPLLGPPPPECWQVCRRPSGKSVSFSADAEQSHPEYDTSAHGTLRPPDLRSHSHPTPVLKYALHDRYAHHPESHPG